MKNINSLSLITAICLLSCKSSVKEQKDKIYSRHLQRHVELTVITTPMPDKKEEMNLLLFNDSEFTEEVRAKKIIDSLFKEKLIQPLTMVAYKGETADYGLEETGGQKGKQHRKFNEFVIDELYPFAKKKVVIRKFKSVAICGFASSALSAFDIAFNNPGKIQSVGMFCPMFAAGINIPDTSVFQTISGLRGRPRLKLWIAAAEGDSLSLKLKYIISAKPNITEPEMMTLPHTKNSNRSALTSESFAAFLMWAFPS